MEPKEPLPRDEGGAREQAERQGARRERENRTEPHVARAPEDPDPDSAIGIEEGDTTPRDRLGRPRPQKEVVVADKVERLRRVSTIRKAILEGYNQEDIIRWVLTKTDWGIEERQIKRYIKQARTQIVAESQRDRAEEVGKAIARNEMIMVAALSPPAGTAKDYRTAMRANALNAKLMGLEAPVRHRHGADPDAPPLPVGGGPFVVLVQEVRE